MGSARHIIGAVFVTLAALCGQLAAAEPTNVISLAVKKPAQAPATMWNATSLLQKAFNNDDLNAMVNERGLQGCESDVQSFVTFSEQQVFKKLSCPGTGVNPAVSMGDLAKGAINRMTSRIANEYISTNKTLKTIVEGKFSLDFSFSDILENVRTVEVVESRPQYVLEVSEKKIKVPAFSSLIGSSAAETVERVIVEKRIVEKWPVILAKRQSEAPSAQSGSMTFGQALAKKMGVARTPFSQFRLRIERTVPGLTVNFAVRLEEINQLAFLDLTSLLKGDPNGMSLGLRLPYQRHALTLEYANIHANPVASYRYTVSASTNAFLTYTAATRQYTSEIHIAF